MMCIVTDLPSFKSSEKLDEKSFLTPWGFLYTAEMSPNFRIEGKVDELINPFIFIA